MQRLKKLAHARSKAKRGVAKAQQKVSENIPQGVKTRAKSMKKTGAAAASAVAIKIDQKLPTSVKERAKQGGRVAKKIAATGGGAMAGAAIGAVAGAGAGNMAGQLPAIILKMKEQARSQGQEFFVGLFGGHRNMPSFVKRFAQNVYSVVWVEMALEGRERVKLVRNQSVATDTVPRSWCICRSFVNWFRYHCNPHDKNVWTKLRDPWWILFNIIALNPVAMSRSVFYLFVLLTIGWHDYPAAGEAEPVKDLEAGEASESASKKPGWRSNGPDEYQLVLFIQSFKSFQFVGTGVVGALGGIMQYYFCVNDPDMPCVGEGAFITGGSRKLYWFSIIGFGLNILLVWVAFLMLQFSAKKQSKNAPKLQAGAAPDELVTWEKDKRAWKYLKFLLFYDFAMFILATVWVGVMMLSTVKWDFEAFLSLPQDRYREWVFWSKTFYALLAMPFFLLNLPLEGVVMSALTHTRPTGYDRNGNVRHVRNKIQEKKTPGQDPATAEDGTELTGVADEGRESAGFFAELIQDAALSLMRDVDAEKEKQESRQQQGITNPLQGQHSVV
jgi:hypothetical protein